VKLIQYREDLMIDRAASMIHVTICVCDIHALDKALAARGVYLPELFRDHFELVQARYMMDELTLTRAVDSPGLKKSIQQSMFQEIGRELYDQWRRECEAEG
jgi:hypothetical protein